MKYLKEFATQADYEAAVAAGLAKPNVSLINEPFGVTYKKYVPQGVKMLHKNGTFFSADEWTANGYDVKDLVGISLITDNVSILMRSYVSTGVAWSSNTTTTIEGILNTNDESKALTDYKGLENTALAAVNDTSGAFYSSTNYTFANGLNGYVPALGELKEIYDNLAAINKCLDAVRSPHFEATTYSYKYIWSSTQAPTQKAWIIDFVEGTIFTQEKGQNYGSAAALIVCAHLEL